ncbi:MAG TPA: hypothetical protein VK215_11395 [Acidimicrobiales bacterium]|nr:hypothetical protein [Acidimicrobiales bacterium]
MRRKTFDMILTAGGAVLVVVLLAAGGLGLWGHSFANSNVHNQLAQQQITLPPAAAFAHAKVGTEITPSMIPSVSQYAGQELTTGPQAEVYADDFIAVHLKEIGGGQTYAQLSAASLADPTNTKLAGQVATVFKGTTLRGLLLEAYAFWTFGQIALIASIVSFVLAGIMLVLTLFGVLHLRRVPADQEFPKARTVEKVPATV